MQEKTVYICDSCGRPENDIENFDKCADCGREVCGWCGMILKGNNRCVTCSSGVEGFFKPDVR